MREPILRRPEARSSAREPRLVRPPGGKALARLIQFVGERGVDLNGFGSGAETHKTVARRSVAVAKRHSKKNGHAAPNYFEAFKAAQKLSASAGAASLAPATQVPLQWRCLGPFSIPHGQTYGSGPGSRPPVAGRVGAIAVDPANSNHILIGSAGGGVWETRDAGGTWTPRTDDQASLATGAIAFDPSNPQNAYAGTGEGDFYAYLGTGLLRSTDGGTTWTVRASSPFVGNGFYELVVDPLDGNHLLAATTGGLYESADGGASWQQRRSARTWDLSMHPAVTGDPNSTAEIFAACDDGLYRSTDGGAHWSAVTLPGSTGSIGRIEVCHAPSDGSIAYVFASIGGSLYLARRETFGGAFAALGSNPPVDVGQAWYDWCAAVAPNNPDVFYVGGIDAFKGTRDAMGNWTWQPMSAQATGDSVHPDQHHIAVVPSDPNVVFLGNDGGIYRSPDAGTTWKSLNKGLCITEFEYLAQHPQHEAYIIAGTQDNGTLRYEGQPVWYHVQDGDGGDCGVDDSSPMTCYHSFYSMGLERSVTGGGWGSWSWLPLPIPAGHSSLFYPPMDVKGSTVVQAGTSLIVSSDAGATWTSVDLPSGTASALSIATSSKIYAGTTDGSIYRTDLAGGAWSVPTALTRPATSGYVSDLLVDPVNTNRLWCTFTNVSSGGFVYRSDDAGTTWVAVGTTLPQIPINAIEIDPSNTNRVFIAADVGVYRTDDAGLTWTAFNRGLPNSLIKDIWLHVPSRLLRVATQNRGMWEIPIDPATIPDVQIYLRDSSVDTGRLTPSPSGVADPFVPGAFTYWWQCPDVKVDAPSYQHATASDVDFQVFQDDHGVFASGLQHENAQRSRVARVYVQVHNRGITSATNVVVKVFFADASVGLPDLPPGFWTGFPNNVLAATAPWQAIASHQTVPRIDAGRAQILSFDWPVPAGAADHSCLLTITSADNDSIATSELVVPELVINNKKCGLKNLTVVNPPPSIGPFHRLVKLNLWPSRGEKRYHLSLDRKPYSTMRGIILSNRLAKFAAENQLKRIKLTAPENEELARLVKRFPALAKQLSAKNAFQMPAKGVILRRFDLSPGTPEPIVVLIGERPVPGRWSLVQFDQNGQRVGGFSFHTIDYAPLGASAEPPTKSEGRKSPATKRTGKRPKRRASKAASVR